MFSVYKRYPFRVPARTKFFNVFRYVFTIPVLERFLVRQLFRPDASSWWKKLIPPLYFYKYGSLRAIERNGFQYRIDLSHMHGHSLYFYNPENMSWRNLFPFLQRHFNVIDAGANIGILSMIFATRCAAGITYSFEPDSDTFVFLQNHISLNRMSNVKLFKNALGESPGFLDLYKVYDNNPGANRILAAAPTPATRSEKVEVTTLDSLMAKGAFAPVHVIKMDIEGFELFCLKGAKNLIEQWRPILFIELASVNLAMQNCTTTDVVSFIEDLRYTVVDAGTMRPVVMSDALHTDILCFPENR